MLSFFLVLDLFGAAALDNGTDLIECRLQAVNELLALGLTFVRGDNGACKVLLDGVAATGRKLKSVEARQSQRYCLSSPDTQSILHHRPKGAGYDHFSAQRGGANDVVVDASIGLSLVERWLWHAVQLRCVTQRKEMSIEALPHGSILGQLAMHAAAFVYHRSQFAGIRLQSSGLQQCIAECLGGHGAGTHRLGASMPEG